MKSPPSSTGCQTAPGVLCHRLVDDLGDQGVEGLQPTGGTAVVVEDESSVGIVCLEVRDGPVADLQPSL